LHCGGPARGVTFTLPSTKKKKKKGKYIQKLQQITGNFIDRTRNRTDVIPGQRAGLQQGMQQVIISSATAAMGARDVVCGCVFCLVRGGREKLDFKVWLCMLAESDCKLRVTGTHLCSADFARAREK
jgi:hypothetical protein